MSEKTITIKLDEFNALRAAEQRLAGLDNKDTIVIKMKDYESLVGDARKVQALEETGVANWSGYDDAMQLLREWGDEDG